MPQAFFISSAAGGVLVIKVKLRSAVNGDNDRDHHAHVALSALVKILGELADVDAVLTKCRAYRGEPESPFLREPGI